MVVKHSLWPNMAFDKFNRQTFQHCRMLQYCHFQALSNNIKLTHTHKHSQKKNEKGNTMCYNEKTLDNYNKTFPFNAFNSCKLTL